MNFSSDNVASVHPNLLEALGKVNQTPSAKPYGADDETAELLSLTRLVFNKPDLEILPVTTGTASNALAIAALTSPWAGVLCHRLAHINNDECGAPEFYSSAKLLPIEGIQAKIFMESLTKAIKTYQTGSVHNVQPEALSLSNLTELGGHYTALELQSLNRIAKHHGLAIHLDGARFANALAITKDTPAALSWQAGVDILSLGATKDGAIAAEMLVIFKPELYRPLEFRRKRSGHLWSKGRFLAAQLKAWLADDLWLKLATDSNRKAARLRQGLQEAGLKVSDGCEGNILFCEMPETLASELRRRGFSFYDWPALGALGRRLVTSWNSRDEDIEALLSLVK